MKRLTVGVIPVSALMLLFAVGTSYAQQRAEPGGPSADNVSNFSGRQRATPCFFNQYLHAHIAVTTRPKKCGQMRASFSITARPAERS